MSSKLSRDESPDSGICVPTDTDAVFSPAGSRAGSERGSRSGSLVISEDGVDPSDIGLEEMILAESDRPSGRTKPDSPKKVTKQKLNGKGKSKGRSRSGPDGKATGGPREVSERTLHRVATNKKKWCLPRSALLGIVTTFAPKQHFNKESATVVLKAFERVLERCLFSHCGLIISLFYYRMWAVFWTGPGV